MDLGLNDRVALVTGARRGIGSAVARTLAREGCHLALVDQVTGKEMAEVAREVTALGRRALELEADVRDLPAAEAAVRRTVEELGRLDILVLNAGITRDAVLWKMDEESWDQVVDVNLKGAFAYARAVAPVLRAAGGGRIVAVASINGMRGKFGQANYAASKAGLIGLAKSMARELGRFGVTVNVVAPGMVRTPMVEALSEEVLERARSEGVLGRLAEPEDVAQVVAFLCSQGARHVTGDVIKVDGGQYI